MIRRNYALCLCATKQRISQISTPPAWGCCHISASESICDIIRARTPKLNSYDKSRRCPSRQTALLFVPHPKAFTHRMCSPPSSTTANDIPPRCRRQPEIQNPFAKPWTSAQLGSMTSKSLANRSLHSCCCLRSFSSSEPVLNILSATNSKPGSSTEDPGFLLSYL